MNEEFPLLKNIDTPEDLKKLSIEQLPQVSKELREFIIDVVSSNPGHLGASLGVVELTVALHYALNTPLDKIIWDVGHQAYGHKILTGRRDIFHTNRKYKGLSGFPKMSESEYDSFGVGHTSTSISAALGIAVAEQQKKQNNQVVAIIGDGSMTGGMAFEGLNNAGMQNTDLTVVLNDNNIAIDENVGALKEYLVDITTSKAYNRIKNDIWHMMGKISKIAPHARDYAQKLENGIKTIMLRQSNLFESLNFRYFGPVDGHDVVHLARLFEDFKSIKGPKLLHVVTKKGKGFPEAEKNQTRYHAPGKFNKTTGKIIVVENKTPQPPLYQQVFGHTILELAKKNEIIVGITVFAVLILTVYIIVLLADISKLTNEFQRVTFQVPYTNGLQGLSQGSPIHLGGFEVGQIVDTGISSEEGGEIFVSFTMELPVQYKLYENCVLFPEQNILGAKAILSIRELGDGGRELADGDIAKIDLVDGTLEQIKKEFDPTNPGSVLYVIKKEIDREDKDSLLGSLVASADNIREVTDSLKYEVKADEQEGGTVLARFKHVAKNLDDITELIKAQLDQENSQAVLARIISSLAKLDDSLASLKGLVTENKDDIGEVVQSLKNSAKVIETELPSIVNKIDQVMEKADNGLETAKAALVELKETATGINEMITANRDRIDLLINNITETSSNLKLVSREVRRAPWRLLYKPNQKELEIQSTVDTAAAFASGAERLDSAAISLKRVVSEMGDKISPDRLNDVLSELEMSFSQFQKAEEKLWQEME
ncbi:MAG: thiamine pyrophosphate-dependent enzyme [Bacteroidales bacterium]|nr:thiamine pyrophosphate-dependent enzyme [Bacteroidales bacterium]